MKEADVPTALVDLALTGAAPGCRDDAAFYLANTIPAIQAAAVRDAAAAWEALKPAGAPPSPFARWLREYAKGIDGGDTDPTEGAPQ